MDIRTKEMNYKLLTKWYYVPSKLHKINPDVSPLCWRECEGEGTHSHIWWHCPLTQLYWKEVLYLVKKICNAEIVQVPWQCLFHATGIAKKNDKVAITPYLLKWM